MKNLNDGERLQPHLLWKNFDVILGIPHPSSHSNMLSDAIYNFGKNLKLETIKDGIGNIVIRKPATSSEMKEIVTLQAHIDMVPQVAKMTMHDFKKDPIKAYIDGDFVRAQGTTLGADNGIGVAAIMAILESNEIEHGPLEALFTVDEETGMNGINYLESDLLQGKYLINTDSEEEGEIFIGCAGGVNVEAIFKFEKITPPQNHNTYKIVISGLKGGHSGCNIHEGRGNSIKIIARLLSSIRENVEFYISEINGGTLRNVIPSQAEVVLLIRKNDDKKFKDVLSTLNLMIKKEYKFGAPHLSLTMNESVRPLYVLKKEVGYKIIDAIYSCPNAVFRMDDNINIVETSSSIGVVTTTHSNIEVQCLARSLVDSARDDAASMVGTVFKLAGAKVTYSGIYPGWMPKLNSPLLQVTKCAYKDIFRKEPKVTAMHAGLECGIIADKYPKMDIISFGPTIREAHSINERVEITSVKKFFTLLCGVLKNIR